MKGQRIGYVRVSSFDQNPDHQLEQTQVDKAFTGGVGALRPVDATEISQRRLPLDQIPVMASRVSNKSIRLDIDAAYASRPNLM